MGTTSTAWTIGNPEAYDQALAEGGVKKLGRGAEPGYEGGWAWRTAGEAQAYADEHWPAFEVYELRLTSTFALSTYLGQDGVCHLLVDSEIVGKR